MYKRNIIMLKVILMVAYIIKDIKISLPHKSVSLFLSDVLLKNNLMQER